MYSDKQLTDLTQGSNISWSCGTLLTLCPSHSTPLSLFLLLSLVPRPPQESGVTSCLGSHSPLSMLILPSWKSSPNSSFSELLQGCTICILTLTGTCTPPKFLCLYQRVLFYNPSLITGTLVVMFHWWFHSCHMVMWLASDSKSASYC